MPTPHRRFTQEFQDEAVRLAETSGRSRRDIAADLGICLSTLSHWIDRLRERHIEHPQEAGGRTRLPNWRGCDERTRSSVRSGRS